MSDGKQEAAFIFICSGFDIETFYVKNLEGVDSLCSLYKFEIELQSCNQEINTSAVINKKATVFLQRNGEYYPYSGIITEFSYIRDTTDYTLYRAVLQPSLWKLTQTTQSRVFQQMTVPEIIKLVLNESGLSSYYENNLGKNIYSQQEYVVQYQETDYNFMLRLMQVNGIWFQFMEASVNPDQIEKYTDGERMIISDNPSVFKSLPKDSVLKYRSRSSMVQIHESKEYETIFELQLQQIIIPKKVLVKNYNYRTPDIDISCEQQVPGGIMGMVYEYGGWYKDVSQAQQYSRIVAHRIAVRKEQVLGKSNCSGMRSGCSVSVEDHAIGEMNCQFVISEVTHNGKMANKSGLYVPAYSNEFKGFISGNACYYHPEFTATKTRMPDFMTARIEGNGTDYSSIDELGRYKIRMPFDASKSSTFQASKYIRMLQEYSGNQYGMHFPTHGDAEVIIAHVNGDPDKPIGIRVVPDYNTISPVTSSNQMQSVIRTAGKNEIIMDDTNGKQQFDLKTPYDMNMNAGHDQNVAITNDRSLHICGNETKTISVDQTISVQGNRTTSVSGNKEETVSTKFLTDTTGESSEKVGGNKSVKVDGDQNEVYSSTRKMEVNGNATENFNSNHIIDIKGASSMKVSGNLSMSIGENEVIKANTMLTIKGETVTLKGSEDLNANVGTAGINMSSKGIIIDAPVINMKAGKVDISAKGNCVNNGLLLMLN